MSGVEDEASPRRIGRGVYEWDLPRVSTSEIAAPRAVLVENPAGEELELTAFDDGTAWRVRLATSSAGTWRWRTADGQAGAFEASGSLAPALRLSENRRFLTFEDGSPFLWLADTAWSIVFKGRPDEWATYLDKRAQQGFSVLQVTLLPWRWEYTDIENNRPFEGGDPSRPNAAYFRRYDQFCQMAAERGLTVCLMLIWGGPRPLLPAIHFSPQQAVDFARYAVARFAAFTVTWSISGDAEYLDELDKWDAIGSTVEATDPYRRPTTNHLPPQLNWAGVHASAAWHDFHMIQTGHRQSAIADIADLPAAYFKLTPTRAFVNGEPWYEAHPARDTVAYGPLFSAYDARYAMWVSVLSGATLGHTYGSQGIWNWKHAGDSEVEVAGPQIGPIWSDALGHAGAVQCGLAAQALRGLQWWRLRPAPERVQMDPPSAELARRPFCALVEDSTWLVYAPVSTGRLTLKGIRGSWQAEWLDPRTGDRHPIGPLEVDSSCLWQAPPAISAEDWVLLVRTR